MAVVGTGRMLVVMKSRLGMVVVVVVEVGVTRMGCWLVVVVVCVLGPCCCC